MKRLLCQIALATLLLTPLSATPLAASAVIEVSSAGDAGPGTLRQALHDATVGDTITFRATIFPPGMPTTIFVRSALPTIVQNNLTIDGAAGVIIDGSQIPRSSDVNGLTISADNCVIRGLTIQKFPRTSSNGNGILITAGASNNLIGGNHSDGAGNLIVENAGDGIVISGVGANNNVVVGNYVGTDKLGGAPRRNRRNGIAILGGASNNRIGGTTEAERNVVGGNAHNGIWIAGSDTTGNIVIGNYLGASSSGTGKVDNLLAGVGIHAGAHHNRIGGVNPGEGNLISNNRWNGVDIRDTGTSFNHVLGNRIGTDWTGLAVLGGLIDGVRISNGATNNVIGNATSGGGNVISGNELDGVRIDGNSTAYNTVQGNYIGSNALGRLALPNGLHGVDLTNGAHHNTIGGDRTITQGNPLGQGNLLSGNLNHGLVIHFDAHHNTAAGNLIGPDASGNALLGSKSYYGSDIAEGAHDNVIGGAAPGQANVISGNQTDGIALFDNTGRGTNDNILIGNIVGLTLSGGSMGNLGPGIASLYGARRTIIKNNIVAFNQGYGVWVAPCVGISVGNTVAQNSIYANGLGGILTDCSTPAPTIKVTAVGPKESVSGTAPAGARVEIFSDDGNQGRFYEGSTQANSKGEFTFASQGSFTGPNITATVIDGSGHTSPFSKPAHVLWTLLLYLNGDNDLSQAIFDTMDNIAAAGPSPRANVLALVDGKSGARAGTVLYDLTQGQTIPLAAPSVTTGERNMGDGQTLFDFVTWARTSYPARHTMLAIVDHGGGWAPSSEDYIPGTQARTRNWLAGGSGLSWDFSSDYDYLSSQEMRQTLSNIANQGKLDVLFYDVCLMGMIEVAYQVKDYTSYFVSSQNIGWAPEGPQSRYVRTIKAIQPTTEPVDLAKLLVTSYAASIPAVGHPFTISAVDSATIQSVADATNQLALALSQRITNQTLANQLKTAYRQAQKIDYDADFKIEPDTDGFVDLYDFALQVAQQFASDPVVTLHTGTLIAKLKTAIVAEQHNGGKPWKYPTRDWSLDRVKGLSIFLPLGEDLVFEVPSAPTLATSASATTNLHLRETYTSSQLAFVGDTKWKDLIDKYYTIAATSIPTSTAARPTDSLMTPDILPPQTTLVVTSNVAPLGATIRIGWSASDAQIDAEGKTTDGSGVTGADLWYRPPGGSWAVYPHNPTQGLPPEPYEVVLDVRCNYSFSVRAVDAVGNREPLEHDTNKADMYVIPCPKYQPMIRR